MISDLPRDTAYLGYGNIQQQTISQEIHNTPHCEYLKISDGHEIARYIRRILIEEEQFALSARTTLGHMTSIYRYWSKVMPCEVNSRFIYYLL